MKLQISAILLLGLLAFSCKKNSQKSGTNNTMTNSFTLKKDGVPYVANYITTSLIGENIIEMDAYLTSSTENNSYALIIRKNLTPGTYLLAEGEFSSFYIYHVQDQLTLFGTENGTLNVLSNDTINHVLHATFEANLFNDEIDVYPVITEGELTVHY